MQYDVLLCDADGVVVKSGDFMFSKQLTREYGIPIEKMLPFFKGAFSSCSIGKADLKEELAKVINDWGWNGDVDQLVQFWLTKGTQVDESTLAYVEEVQRSGVRCYMTTDNEKYRGEFLTKALGHGKPFKDVFYSAKLGVQKHEQTFFQKVYDAVNEERRVVKDRILFVDDDEENIEAAKAFGLVVHHYTELKNLKNFLA